MTITLDYIVVKTTDPIKKQYVPHLVGFPLKMTKEYLFSIKEEQHCGTFACTFRCDAQARTLIPCAVYDTNNVVFTPSMQRINREYTAQPDLERAYTFAVAEKAKQNKPHACIDYVQDIDSF